MSDPAIVTAASAPPPSDRTTRKRRAILDAATDIFLSAGYLGASMDDIAAASNVSKQTIYKQFVSKEALFVAAVTRMTNAGGDAVHNDVALPTAKDDVADYLERYGLRQLQIVLTPRLLRLRRMVIGEANAFPQLGQALYQSGPARAMTAIAAALARLTRLGLLAVEDADAAAAHFNWLIMGGPLNAAMLLGDAAVPDPCVLRRHAKDAVRVFLAAYAAPAARPGRGR